MATSFPTSLDALTNPISTNALNSPSHADQHANANDAIEAIQAAIGTTAAPVLAKLASPTFTGTPTLPTGTIATTQTAADSSTKLATTAFVTTADNLKANLASPTFTGTLTADIISSNRGEFVTSAAAGRGVGIKAPAGDASAGILQFTNNAQSVQWASVSATNGVLNLNATTVNTSAISNSGTITSYTGTTSVWLGGWSNSANYGVVQGNKGYIILGNSVGDSAMYVRTGTAGNVNIGAQDSNTLQVGNGAATMNGTLAVTNYIAVGGTGVTDTGSVSCSGWFRPTGDTGIYFQSWGGGWHMTDSTWIRGYNGKNVYMPAVVRCGYTYSGNAGRVRGSYGSVSFDSNGSTGGWDGIEFTGSPQTFMILGDYYSGMYRNNNTWNWLWNYSTLVYGSDERYKREIQPLGLGMKFIEHLEPISYLRLTEETDDDPEATEKGYYYGFTAQNVRAALDACGETRDVKIHDIGGPNMGLVACTEDAVYDRQFLGITEFLAPIVEAIKELNVRLKTLEGV